jgi:hypothetical protein
LKVTSQWLEALAANFARIAACWLSLSAVGLSAGQLAERQARNCPTAPVAPCAVVHGRFSTQNGIPQTVWVIGTRRRLSVANEAKNFFSARVLKYLELTSPDHSYVFGDFTVCPIEADVPGHMRAVCVADAKNLVVQNAVILWPPFRVKSTWSHRAK